MEKERIEVVEYGKRMSQSGLTNGTSGNISMYDPEKGYMAISPSGIGYMETKPEDVVVLDINGNIIEGDKNPSSEYLLHAEVYKKFSNARAVVHTHSTYCATFACLGMPIEAVHYLIAGASTHVIPVVPYATFGSAELAENLQKTKADGNAMLLANHGMVAYADTIAKAYNVAENVEWVAHIQYLTMSIGKPNILPVEEIARVINKNKSYGQEGSEKTGY